MDYSIIECETKDIRDEIKKVYKKGTHFILIGGDDIIPFCRIENPARDYDKDVLSDNCYASLDADFLLPEISLSRIPDGNNPNFFIQLISSIGIHHTAKGSIGYTAKVWIEASKSVYETLPDRKDILTSPPMKSILLGEKISEKQFFYFNLHGSDTDNPWYGQEGGNYPVALMPENIKTVDGGFVFSEACYGAYILKKKVKNSIALKFLENGISAFCGSTTIAYGPAAPPSTEADLLAKFYFQNLLNGEDAGNAFLNAKHQFFKEMIKTQGFLDGDDKKTLYQFVLYGDPERRING